MKFAIAAFLFSVFGFSSAKASEAVVLVGGPSGIKFLESHKAKLEAAVGSPIELRVSSADGAFGGLAKGVVDGVVTGDTIEDIIKKSRDKGQATGEASEYQSIDLAISTVRAGVHPENPVKSLSHDQIKDVLSGKILSWSAINGVDGTIKVLLAKDLLGVNAILKKTYMNSNAISVAEAVVNSEGMVRGIEQNKFAIGFFTSKITVGAFTPKYINTDSRLPIFLITKKSAPARVTKALDAIKALPNRTIE